MALHETRYGWWYLPVTTAIQEVEAEVQDHSLLSTESEASRGIHETLSEVEMG